MKEDFNCEKDFWTSHPQFEHTHGFRKFRAKNPPKDSSTFMWLLKFIYHPQSLLVNLPLQEKIDLAELSILREKGFFEQFGDNDEVKELIALYQKLVETPLDRSIRIIKDKLHQKEKFIEDNEYNLTTFEAIDKAIISLEKQNDLVDKLESKKVNKETSTKKGNEELSDSDKQLI